MIEQQLIIDALLSDCHRSLNLCSSAARGLAADAELIAVTEQRQYEVGDLTRRLLQIEDAISKISAGVARAESAGTIRR